MLRRVALLRTNVSEEPGASFMRVTKIGVLGTTQAATSNRRTLRRNTLITIACKSFQSSVVCSTLSSSTAWFRKLNGSCCYCLSIKAYTFFHSFNPWFLARHGLVTVIKLFLLVLKNFLSLSLLRIAIYFYTNKPFYYNQICYCEFTMASSGMLRRVALLRTNVSEELCASIIRMRRIGELGTTLAVTSNRRMLWRNTKCNTKEIQRS
jgi:hypothetical protein